MPKVRHLTTDDVLVVQEEGSDLAAQSAIEFTGAGVAVTDDSGNQATVVTVSGGGSVTLETDNWVEYGGSISAGAGGPIDLGTVYDSGAGLSWIGSGAHNPAGGLIETTEDGLYVVNCRTEQTGALTAPPTYPPQLKVSTYDYDGLNQIWFGPALRLVGNPTPSTGLIGHCVNFTVPLVAGDIIYFHMYYRIAMSFMRTYIAKIA